MLKPIRRFGRAVINRLDNARRSWRLPRVVQQLRDTPADAQELSELVSDLRETWGNVAWSADIDYLHMVADRSAIANGNILECGSGVTTIVAATLLERNRGTLWCLEQDRFWYQHMAAALSRTGLHNVRLFHAPLISYGDYVWYDLKDCPLPDSFSCVFCDGPAVLPQEFSGSQHSLWRGGLVPALHEKNITIREILLDDAEDERCDNVRKLWESFGYSSEILAERAGSVVVARPS